MSVERILDILSLSVCYPHVVGADMAQSAVTPVVRKEIFIVGFASALSRKSRGVHEGNV